MRPSRALLLTLAACSPSTEPNALEPGSGARAARDTAADATLVDPGIAEARDQGLAAPSAAPTGSAAPGGSDAPADPPAAEPLPERVRTLIDSVDAYGRLPGAERTAARREVYQTELLELGQELTRLAREREGTMAGAYLDDKSLHVLEELAWEAGEDSAFGLKAYQLLADEKRRAGLEDEAQWFDEAIQRLLAEQAEGRGR